MKSKKKSTTIILADGIPANCLTLFTKGCLLTCVSKSYDLPEGVSIHSRESYLFIENYNDHAVTVKLPGIYRNMETGLIYNETIPVEPYNIIIVCTQK